MLFISEYESQNRALAAHKNTLQKLPTDVVQALRCALITEEKICHHGFSNTGSGTHGCLISAAWLQSVNHRINMQELSFVFDYNYEDYFRDKSFEWMASKGIHMDDVNEVWRTFDVVNMYNGDPYLTDELRAQLIEVYDQVLIERNASLTNCTPEHVLA